MEKIIVTGCSGFIGMHLCDSLLDDGYTVLGLDNMNNYYDINLKKARLKKLSKKKNFRFIKIDISDFQNLTEIFNKF